MPKKFVLGTSLLPPEKEAELVRYFESRDLTWWHWLPNLWLIVGSESFSTALLRDGIRPVVGTDKELLVLETSGDSWAGASYERNGAKMGAWLDSVWAKN